MKVKIEAHVCIEMKNQRNKKTISSHDQSWTFPTHPPLPRSTNLECQHRSSMSTQPFLHRERSLNMESWIFGFTIMKLTPQGCTLMGTLYTMKSPVFGQSMQHFGKGSISNWSGSNTTLSTHRLLPMIGKLVRSFKRSKIFICSL